MWLRVEGPLARMYVPMQLEENVESISDAGIESLVESAGSVEAEMRAAVLDSASIEKDLFTQSVSVDLIRTLTMNPSDQGKIFATPVGDRCALAHANTMRSCLYAQSCRTRRQRTHTIGA